MLTDVLEGTPEKSRERVLYHGQPPPQLRTLKSQAAAHARLTSRHVQDKLRLRLDFVGLYKLQLLCKMYKSKAVAWNLTCQTLEHHLERLCCDATHRTKHVPAAAGRSSLRTKWLTCVQDLTVSRYLAELPCLGHVELFPKAQIGRSLVSSSQC